MSVIYTDIDNIKKYRNIMIDIDSSLFSYIKAKIKVSNNNEYFDIYLMILLF